MDEWEGKPKDQMFPDQNVLFLTELSGANTAFQDQWYLIPPLCKNQDNWSQPTENTF